MSLAYRSAVRMGSCVAVAAAAACAQQTTASSGGRMETAVAGGRVDVPVAGRVTLEQVRRGRLLVITHACAGCHGGGDNPANPNWLSGARTPQDEFVIGPFKTRPRNITPDNVTGIGRFSMRQIFNALRYGLRPGETPDVEITSMVPGQGNFPSQPKYLAPPMPWPEWRHMSDQELWDIAAYLKHGVKPVTHRVADSEGPPDFWAGAYADTALVGPYPARPFPTANEEFRP